MTSAPPKNWITPPAAGQNAGQGFGVDYLGLDADMAQAAPPAPTWAQRVRGNAGMPAALPLTPTEQSNLDQTELSLQYPNLTAQEWRLLHNPEDIRRKGLTLAESHKAEDMQVKWVKFSGLPAHTEIQDGAIAQTWQRGSLIVYEVTRSDGTSQNWLFDSNSTLRYHLGSNGEVIRKGTDDNYQVGIRQTNDLLFVDCSLSAAPPQSAMPVSGSVNGRKGQVAAHMSADGQILIGGKRGTIKDHQFIVKLPQGAYVTVDSEGTPMLADLKKLPPEIPLSAQDMLQHSNFAAELSNGKASLDTFVQQDTSPKHSQLEKFRASEKSIHATRQHYNRQLAMEASGQLGNAPEHVMRSDIRPSVATRNNASALGR